ncbi:MAG TPA: hypothetical protein VEK84_09045 [Terriglobales bacterium]|nr:hypothetical protein [Terriglobales bacterium]
MAVHTAFGHGWQESLVVRKGFTQVARDRVRSSEGLRRRRESVRMGTQVLAARERD